MIFRPALFFQGIRAVVVNFKIRMEGLLAVGAFVVGEARQLGPHALQGP